MGCAIPLISIYSDRIVISHIVFVMIAPTNICNGSKMKGLTGMKLIINTGIAITIATPKPGRISFICSLIL